MHHIPQVKVGKGEVVQDLPDAQYRAFTALSQSALKEYARSPRHYAHSLVEAKEPTPALIFGQAFHAMMDSLGQEGAKPFAVMPKVDGRTKEGKAIKEQFAAENAGAIIVSEEEGERLYGMQKAALGNEAVCALLDECNDRELSLFGYNEGILCKSRFDMLSGHTIVDWKTTEDASPQEVARSIRNFRYDLQASFYQSMANVCKVEVRRFVFVFIEKKAPHGIALYSISQRSLEKADYERVELMAKFKSCIDAYGQRPWQEWPCYSEDIVELEVWP